MSQFRLGASTALCLALSLMAPHASAQSVPQTIGLQGHLKTTSSGDAVEGNVSLEVRLYPNKTAITAVFTETHAAVEVLAGRFKVAIGSVVSLPATFFQTYPSVWVGLSVDGGDELPRRQIISTPFTMQAQRSSTSASADTATSLTCVGCVDANKVAASAVTLSKLSTEVHGAFVSTGGDTVTGLLVAQGGLTVSGSVDFNNVPVGNFRLETSTTHPATCTAGIQGRQYYNSSDDNVYTCNGTSWVGLSTGVPSDEDGDGVSNINDNCLLIQNPGQEDLDSDGKGDVCDTDDDGDGVLDNADNCPTTANALQVNTDNDS